MAKASSSNNQESLIVALAKKYISAKTGGLSDELLNGITLNKMKDAIRRLHDNDFLPELSGDTAVSDIIDAVKRFQKEFGLTKDGELGEITFDWLMLAKRCFGKLGRRRNRNLNWDRKKLPNVEDDGTSKPLEIRYYVDELPKDRVSNADQLLMMAWESWISVCGMIATEITDDQHRNKANVIIGMRRIDGASNILADAHVGPPRSRQLILSFDASEPWDETIFQGTACHEIGHLLGIRHRGARRGDIMFPKYSADILGPSDHDAERAVAIWGPPPPAPGPVTRHPGNFLIDDD